MIGISDVFISIDSGNICSNLGDWITFLEEKESLPDRNDLWNCLKSERYRNMTLGNSLQCIIINELQSVFFGITDFEIEINGLATRVDIAGVMNPNLEELHELYKKYEWAREYYNPTV